jgi:hypothetical protein
MGKPGRVYLSAISQYITDGSQPSFGEPLTGYDPEISEWDNPRRDYLPAHSE